MKGRIGRAAAGALGVALLVTGSPAGAHGEHKAPAAAAQPAGAVKVKLTDVGLLDQDGRRVRVLTDVFGDRLVVINFVYTTCTTICPLSSATLAQLQERLGARLGHEVALVSLSVDPVRDTPARLKEYSTRHGAKAGWTWLTGRKGDVDSVSKAFGVYTPNPDDHPALVMVGDPRSRNWTRLFGFPSADELHQRLDQLAAARSGGSRNH